MPALAGVFALAAILLPAPPRANAGEVPAPPLISIDPDCHPGVIEGSFQVAFTFRLRNFTPGAEVTVAFGFDEQQQQQPVVVGDYGGADAPLTFELGARTNVPIRAFETANPAVTASTELLIPCTPSLRLTPNCDAPADLAAPRPLSVTVEGFNWDPANGIVNVALVSPLEDVPLAETRVAPDENRSFTVTLDQARAGGPLMALAAGQYYVTGVQFQASAPSSVQVDFVVPCAQLELRPSCGPAGEPPATFDIALSGLGFVPGVPAHVIFDVFGNQQVFVLDVPPSGELRFPDPEEARIRPYQRPDGEYWVIVRQGTPKAVVREAAATFIVPCPPDPELFVDPLCGPPQLVGDDTRTYSLRVSGINLPTGTLVLTFDTEGRSGPPEVIELPVSGTLEQRVTVAARPRSVYLVSASIVTDGPPFERAFEFTVPCRQPAPTISLRCDPPETNQPELAEIVIQLRGFYAGSVVVVMIGPTVETLRTDVDGSLNLRRAAADWPPGALGASATQSDANGTVAEASASLVLPCGTRDPLLVITPLAGSPGVVVRVRGFNFRANSTVSLRWSQGIGSRQPIDVAVGADGTFSRQVLIFHRDRLGSRELTVEASEDPLAVGISTDLLVVPGRGSPPAYIILGRSPDLPGTIVIRR